LSEAKLTEQCRTYFKKIRLERPDFFWWKISDKYSSGIPDFFVAYNGVAIFIELKDKGRKPGKLQEYTLRCLNRAGVLSIWADDFKTVQAFVEGQLSLVPSVFE